MQSPHPYIVFKDIDPSEMELLLNYMYQGEVNVVQEKLPSLIKAAEALKIKGLAVPDDLPSGKDSSGKKRSNSSQSESEPKRRLEQRNRSSSQDMDSQSEANKTQPRIKEEPLDASEYSDNLLHSYPEDSVGHEASTHLPCDSQ
ncbi:UNVERIFIED_CONTAM: hypothetical protein GTU68_005202, partial [Idotea baltica]|nr:hypothetical protein [Idotea baltica]